MTFKQLEAIYWAVELGGFSRAAYKLHTTQSAVSKRIGELESLFETPLFDRSLRSARLTEKGEEMLILARRLLEQRDAAVAQFARPEVVERRVRLGVTEMTAMTWLPRLVTLLRARYPRVIIEPDVDNSVTLRDKLLADEIDLMIVPSAFDDAKFTSTPVGRVELAWMCKPGLLGKRRPLGIHELAKQRLLIQGEKSGTGLIYSRWFGTIGLEPAETIISNNLVALIGLAVSGLGVSYLPRRCLGQMIEQKLLEVVKVDPPLPEVTYVAVHRREIQGSVIPSIVGLAEKSCDFTRTYFGGHGESHQQEPRRHRSRKASGRGPRGSGS
jgi:DNA-binding transcriptional LysR family regulator